MDSVSVLNVVQALVRSRHISGLMAGLLRGIRQNSEVPVAICYLRDVFGEQLLAAQSTGIDASVLPGICANELDNPLWYCMHTRKACLVDKPFALLGVGAGFEKLRNLLGEHHALLAWPLLDGQGQALGSLVLSANASVLHDWRDNQVWTAVMTVHQELLGTLSEQLARGDLLADTLPSDDAQRSMRQVIKREFAGDSLIARKIREELLQLAQSQLAVLITGETGAGKDHAGWLIHQASTRRHKAFVPVNCASIPKDLIESELFGCTRGAFTGASESREGLVAAADGGTLFLDEIGDMPLALQGTLLRLLNEKKYRPVGAVQERTSDFRLLCATHQPLSRLVREGRFREDLYYRICQLSLRLPSLRSRREDLGPLVATLIREHNRQQRRSVAGIADTAVQALAKHSFPGNIRELRNLIVAACERTTCGQAIGFDVLQALMNHTLGSAEEGQAQLLPDMDTLQALLQSDDLPQAVDTFERLMIDARLQQLGGSRRRAAESLGMPKRTLARKCQKWSLESASYD